MKATIEECTSE